VSSEELEFIGKAGVKIIDTKFILVVKVDADVLDIIGSSSSSYIIYAQTMCIIIHRMVPVNLCGNKFILFILSYQ